MEFSPEQLRVLTQKLQIIGHLPALLSQAYARSVRQLYLEARLKLVSVTDMRSFKRDDDETDLAAPASICTYDELAMVVLNKDLTVTLFIKEGTRSFYPQPSVPRVNFTLSGDWWAINKNGEGFPHAIEAAFKRYAAVLFEKEEEERKRKRCIEIENQLLVGTYESP